MLLAVAMLAILSLVGTWVWIPNGWLFGLPERYLHVQPPMPE